MRARPLRRALESSLPVRRTLQDLCVVSVRPIVPRATGGAEAALLERVSHLEHVFTATEIGAAGILEAIAALDLHPTPKG